MLRLTNKASSMLHSHCSVYTFLRSLGLICILFLGSTTSDVAGSVVGVCYGSQGDNLPPPERAVQLMQSQSIDKVRIFTYDPDMLRAFANSNIRVIIGVTNPQLPELAQSTSAAQEWVNNNVASFIPATNVVGIAVGSEVLTTSPDVSGFLVGAMGNVYSALAQRGLEKQVMVSTPHSMGVLGTSFPPSAGRFDQKFTSVMQPLLSFLSQTGSHLMVNVYPYYAYRNQMKVISADFALLKPNPGFNDPNSGLHYWNLFDAQLDALYYAMADYGYRDLDVVVSETGWPSMGDPDEVNVVNLKNAASYNGNLVKHLSNGTGTPLRPGATTETYIFELFNEDLKPGPSSNRNWGLFKPDGSKVYEIDLGGGGAGVIQINRTFCVANPDASYTDLQIGLDWACGPGQADCQAIQPGQACYLPDSVASHASYAFNSYYQSNGLEAEACSFSGAATITSADPSYGSCVYRGSLLPGGRGISTRQPLLWPMAVVILISVLT